MLVQEQKGKRDPVKVYCTSCWADRIITTNGKCHSCGSKLLRPKHWDTTIKKLEILAKTRADCIGLEIKNRLYLVPHDYLKAFQEIERSDMKQIGEFIESIKNNCTSFKV